MPGRMRAGPRRWPRARRDGVRLSEEAALSIEEKLDRAQELKPDDRQVLDIVRKTYRSLGWSGQAADADRRWLAAAEQAMGASNGDARVANRAVAEF